jgi:dethiobiotin synthetase
MKDIFVSATNTHVGKTYATLHLMQAYANKGYRVGAYKPIETGVDTVPQDGWQLLQMAYRLNNDFTSLSLSDIVTYSFKKPAAPYVAKECPIDLVRIKESYRKLKKHCDILFVEGAGGLMVPIERGFFMIDLAKMLDLELYLITPSKLGCINDTLLSLQALKANGISHQWFVNLFEDKESFFDVTAPFYQDYFGGYKLLEDIVI